MTRMVKLNACLFFNFFVEFVTHMYIQFRMTPTRERNSSSLEVHVLIRIRTSLLTL